MYCKYKAAVCAYSISQEYRFVADLMSLRTVHTTIILGWRCGWWTLPINHPFLAIEHTPLAYAIYPDPFQRLQVQR